MPNKTTLCLILMSLSLGACTGALNTTDIRQGNYQAPRELQVAEDCNSNDPKQNCKVIISHPPQPETSSAEENSDD